MIKSLYIIVLITISVSLAGQTPVPVNTFWDKIKFNADLRTRTEYDWMNITAAGDTNDNRLRLRTRARFGFTYQYNDKVEFGMRLRAGNAADQQSPHVSFGTPGESAPIGLAFDKAYIKVNYKGLWATTGKNTYPFYYHNELFWDEDVTPEGIAAGYDWKIGNTTHVKPTVGFFFISSTGKPFDTDVTLKAAQLHVNVAKNKSEINIASGIFSINDLPNLPDGTGTFKIDYTMVVSNLKYTYKSKIPIAITADIMLNLENYTDSTIIANQHQDQTTGYVVGAELGQLKDKKNYMLGVYYAHIEKYSVVDYFAQDDWLRWGYSSASGTRSSNFEGVELRAGYAFGPKFNLLARTYLCNGIVANTPQSDIETANRFRLDLNIAF